MILSVKQLLLYGDSLARQLGGLLADSIYRGTSVTCFCTHLAGWRMSSLETHHHLGAAVSLWREQIISPRIWLLTYIINHIETYVVALLPTAKILVATLPCRHDLAESHPINDEIFLVNSHIYELCSHLEGAGVIDLNQMERECLTSHGLVLS